MPVSRLFLNEFNLLLIIMWTSITFSDCGQVAGISVSSSYHLRQYKNPPDWVASSNKSMRAFKTPQEPRTTIGRKSYNNLWCSSYELYHILRSYI